MSSEAAALSHAISDIYDAAIDARLWPKAMQSSCKFVGGFQSTMFWQDSAEADVVTLFNYNDDPTYSRAYGQTYAPLNPVFPAAIFQPVGSVTAFSDLVPDAEMRETRFYEEWMAPQNLTGALAVVIERDATRAAFMAVQWKGGTIDDDARRRMALLVPHLQRAVAIGRLFVKHSATEAAFTETLHHVEAAVFLVAADGRIVFANMRGRRMLEDAKLVREREGRLRAVAADADRALLESLLAIEEGDEPIEMRDAALALADAANGIADDAPGDTGLDAKGIAILLASDARRSEVAHVLPLASRVRGDLLDVEAVAAVFVRRTAVAAPAPLEIMARLYGLTAAEIRVLAALAGTTGVADMARMLGLGEATVKSHLHRLFTKTGARRQADLITLLAKHGTPLGP